MDRLVNQGFIRFHPLTIGEATRAKTYRMEQIPVVFTGRTPQACGSNPLQHLLVPRGLGDVRRRPGPLINRKIIIS